MGTTFTNARLYRRGRFEFADFEVAEGRITTVTPRAADTVRHASTSAIDLGGRFVLPGLIDAHAHLVLSSDAQRDEPLTARILKGVRNAKAQLRAGVTSVRDVGGPGRIAVDLKAAISAGIIEGPRVSTSGSFVCVTGGHVSYWGREADGADDARRAVREQRKAAADFIKVMASGGVADEGEDPNSAQFTRAELEAICDEANSTGAYVAAHAHPAGAIRQCLEVGVRTIEHASFIDDAGIEAALRSGAYIVPTFIVYDVIARSEHLPAHQRDLAARVLDRKAECFLAADSAGVKWGVGTDAGSFMPQGQLWQEMAFLTRLGLDVARVLEAATETNAEILRDDALGRLEPGCWADAVVLDADPTQDIESLARPSAVIKRGQIVHITTPLSQAVLA